MNGHAEPEAENLAQRRPHGRHNESSWRALGAAVSADAVCWPGWQPAASLAGGRREADSAACASRADAGARSASS
jgi:hypothetical protein